MLADALSSAGIDEKDCERLTAETGRILDAAEDVSDA